MAVTVQHPTYGLIEFPDGYTEAQINNALIDLDAREGEQYGIGETLYRAAERGLTSTARGIEQGVTDEIAPGLSLFGMNDMTDLEKERELRIMLQQNPISGYSALLLGSLADPVTLPFAWTKLIKAGNIVAQGASRGAAGGATGGLLEPTYDEFGDSTVLNVMAGTGLGAGLGAAAGKIIQRVQEGPTVKVEGDEQGVTIPESIRQDGKLRDEVFSAIQDTELAAIEARVGQNMQEAGQIDDLQKVAQRTYDEVAQPLAQVPTPAQRAFNPVQKLQEELTPVAAKALPRRELQTLQKSLDSVNSQLAKAQKIASGRKTVAAKARADETVAKIQAQQQKIAGKVAEAQEAARAQRYINTLSAGRIEKLPQAQQARLATLQQEAGADIATTRAAVQQEAQKLPEPIEAEVTALNARVAERVNPIEYKPVRQPAPEQPAPQAQAPLGLDPRPGVGSTGTRPSQRFAATSPDAPGTEAVRRAMIERTVPEQDRFTVSQTEGGIVKTPTQIVGATEAERNFHSRLQAESSEQLVRLRNETHGRYSWNNVSNAAVEVEGRILNDYDDLAEWLSENDENIFKAAELEALTPLIQEAQQRMFDSRKILFALNREGRLDSEEAVRVMQDIQYYNYIGNSAYIAQKTKISNAMSQLRKMKGYMNVQEGDLERGKQINQIMFGVTC